MTRLFDLNTEGKPGDTYAHEIHGVLFAVGVERCGISACSKCIGYGTNCEADIPGCNSVIWIKNTRENRLKVITARMTI